MNIKLANNKTEISVAKYNAQTLELFNLECKADSEIALTAKTNNIMGVRDNESCNKTKITCKGGRKRRNKDKLT